MILNITIDKVAVFAVLTVLVAVTKHIIRK
jgi:hypothetical protein